MTKILSNMSFLVLRYLKFRSAETVPQIIKCRFCTNQLIKSQYATGDLDDIDWKKEISTLDSEQKSVIAATNEDYSDFRKFLKPTLTVTPLVNKSETLRNFVQLGVNIHEIEKKHGVMETILRMNYDPDIKQYITFLGDYVDHEELGSFLTKNPHIFNESIEDLQVRINYLESKKFDESMIKRIVSANPYWLSFSTLRIDRRLGHFQKVFDLSGPEVRMVVTRQPRLITYNLHHVKVNTFSIHEEMGFSKNETKHLLLNVPRVWMMNNQSLMGRFNYLHSTMNVSHHIICKMPGVLYCKLSKLRNRHTFLEKLGRAQFDCTKPNYVSILNLVQGTDVEFCTNYAKCTVADYNLYLKTL